MLRLPMLRTLLAKQAKSLDWSILASIVDLNGSCAVT